MDLIDDSVFAACAEKTEPGQQHRPLSLTKTRNRTAQHNHHTKDIASLVLAVLLSCQGWPTKLWPHVNKCYGLKMNGKFQCNTGSLDGCAE